MGRVLVDDLPGERPGAVRVRVILPPHDVTGAEELDQVKSHQVGLIGRPNLALEHLARRRFQWDVPGLLSLELSAVAVVHLLNDEWDPADRGFGEAELQFGMALQGSEGEHIYERVEKRSSAIAEPHIEDPLALTGFHRVNRGPDRSRLCAATDVVRHDDAGIFRRVPKHVPWLLIHSESHIVDQKVRFAEAQLCDADDFIPGGLRVDGREHGNGIEALRRAAHDPSKNWASGPSTSSWTNTPGQCDRRLKSSCIPLSFSFASFTSSRSRRVLLYGGDSPAIPVAWLMSMIG